jgi:hypothetical protein
VLTASHTVENEPSPSFRITLYLPSRNVSPRLTGWKPPGRYSSAHSQSAPESLNLQDWRSGGSSVGGVAGGEAIEIAVKEVEEARTRCKRCRRGQRKQASTQLRVTMAVCMQLRTAMAVSLHASTERHQSRFRRRGVSVIHGPCGVGCGVNESSLVYQDTPQLRQDHRLLHANHDTLQWLPPRRCMQDVLNHSSVPRYCINQYFLRPPIVVFQAVYAKCLSVARYILRQPSGISAPSATPQPLHMIRRRLSLDYAAILCQSG